ncbi:MAG: pyridoxamine 5'-phosphate oxidase [Paraglaciecola sp.]|jgi:pyridoxamine 5'-phosphate oxidase
MEHPLIKFKLWWEKAIAKTSLQQKSAVCISTINQDGFPEGRFVDLKEVNDDGFVFCTYLDSSKGRHIKQNPKVSLTIWWDHVGYQVRIVGKAQEITKSMASKYWSTRQRDAQLTTSSFQQSQILASEEQLIKQFEAVSIVMKGKEILKPDNWGGYLITPLSIEFLTFNENRLHLREIFKNENGVWLKSLLQP